MSGAQKHLREEYRRSEKLQGVGRHISLLLKAGFVAEFVAEFWEWAPPLVAGMAWIPLSAASFAEVQILSPIAHKRPGVPSVIRHALRKVFLTIAPGNAVSIICYSHGAHQTIER